MNMLLYNGGLIRQNSGRRKAPNNAVYMTLRQKQSAYLWIWPTKEKQSYLSS